MKKTTAVLFVMFGISIFFTACNACPSCHYGVVSGQEYCATEYSPSVIQQKEDECEFAGGSWY